MPQTGSRSMDSRLDEATTAEDEYYSGAWKMQGLKTYTEGDETSRSFTGENRRGLFLREDVVDGVGHLRAGPILRADQFADDSAFAVDDVGVWVHYGAVGGRDFFRDVAKIRIVHGVLLEKFLEELVGVVDADADDGAAEGLNALLEGNKRIGFFHAGRAGGEPKIEEDDFAAEVGKVHWLAVNGEREIRGCGAGEARLALAVVGRDEKIEQGRDEKKDECCEEFAFQSIVPAKYTTETLRRIASDGENWRRTRWTWR
jgi:hypothetical protein